MRLTIDTANEMNETLREMVDDCGREVQEAAEGYIDLDGDNTTEARESRSEYREQWDGAIEELESQAVALVALFGYTAVPTKQAKKAGLA